MSSRGNGRKTWILFLPAGIFLALFTASFAVMIVISTYHYAIPPKFWTAVFTSKNYLSLVTSRYSLYTIGNTLYLSLVTTIITVFFAYPIAQLLVRPSSHPTRGKILLGTVILLFFVNSIVRTVSWFTVLSSSGLLSQLLVLLHILPHPISYLFTSSAVVIGMVSYNMPFAILMLASSLRFVGFELEDAARTLGANELQTFRRITFPLSEIPLLATANLMFVVSIAAFVSPSILGGGVVPFITVNIYQTAVNTINYPEAAAFSVFFTLLTVIVIVASGRLFEVVIPTGVRKGL